jgi:hypothetical protein
MQERKRGTIGTSSQMRERKESKNSFFFFSKSGSLDSA